MKAQYMAIFAGVALVLGACATAQENPNYQHSTKYKGQGQVQGVGQVQGASAGAATTNYVNYETQPAAQVIYASSQTHTTNPAVDGVANTYYYETAPTDQHYADQDYVGTPGYQAIHGTGVAASPQTVPAATQPQYNVQVVNAPMVTTETASGIEIVSYDYSDNVINANAEAVSTIESETRIISAAPAIGQSYLVEQGDTVYSLARSLCVSVGEIQSVNNLGADFGINIGQTLSLPQSRC